MRTVLLILVPMMLLAGGFYFFLFRERPALYVAPPVGQTSTTRKSVPTTVPVIEPQPSVIGQSGGVFLETRNKKGRLTNDFRSQRFDPRKDGDVDVVLPEGRFYGENGGIVTVTGSSGRVALSQPGDRSDPQALGSASPTSGVLQDVIVRFYEKSLNEEPTIVTKVPAVHFDAIANRVTTIDSVINGKGVMAEQVPVNVRGRDFELDGQGMTLRWNDREGRLEELVINHGDRLLVKNVERFTGSAAATATQAPTSPAIAMKPVALALVGEVDAPSAETPTTKPAAHRDLYHATFDKDVTVTRDGAQLAAADVMRVVLPLGDSKGDKPTTAPTTTAPTTTTTNAVHHARRPDETKKVSDQPSDAAATTAPVGGPLEVRWTGKLTLRPAILIPDAPHEQMVEFVGSPAWVAENGGRVDGRLIHAEPDSGRMRVEPGGGVRSISVRDPGGAELRSHSPLIVDRTTGFAEINGGGTLVAPPAQGATLPTTVLWSKHMLLTLGKDEAQSLKEIALDGATEVTSDAFKMNCESLRLAFDPSTDPPKTPAANKSQFSMPPPDASLLRVVDATGTAKMDLGADDAARHLAGDHIQIGLVAANPAVGEVKSAAVTQVKCDGNVTLVDAKGLDLSCAALDVKTKPISLAATRPTTQPTTQTAAQTTTTRPSGDASLDQVTSMLATGHVRLHQADGSSASGDRVEMNAATTADGLPTKKVVLLGQPASVASERGSLEGAHIDLDQQTGNVAVPGPGKFVGNDAQQPNNTMALAWADSMTADGTTGICNLNGGVNIDGSDVDGTRLLATAKHGVIEFTTRKNTPGTNPSTQPSPARPTTAPAMSGVTLDSIRALHLTEDVDVAINSQDVRNSSVQTQKLDIDLEAGTVTAPQEGRMMMIETRPTTRPSTQSTTQSTTEPTLQANVPPATLPTTKPATSPTTRSTQGKFGPGTLAVAWQDNMLWKLHEGTLTMNGGIRLGFEKEKTNDPIHLTCDRLICGLTPIETGKGAEQSSQRVEIHTVRAEQNVTVRSKLASFDSSVLTFDTLSNRATATGTDDTPVDVYSANDSSHVGFSQVTWNLETGLIEDFRDMQGRIRR